MRKRSGVAVVLGLILVGGLGRPAAAQTADPPRVRVFPPDVYPVTLPGETRWTAQVAVSLSIAAPADTPIRLAADERAVLATPYVVIPRGATSQDVEVTATGKGEARIYAWVEETGAMSTTLVTFHLRPSKLRISIDPPRSFSLGTAGAVTVTVSLLDRDGKPCVAENKTDVALVVPFGKLDQAMLPIAAGSFQTAVHLSSLVPAQGEVSAEVDGMEKAKDQVEFVFPWAILGVAMMGGACGAAYQSASRTWQSRVVAGVPGTGFGMMIYGLVAFLPVNNLPGVIQPLAALPVTSILGAAVLGVAAGYCGRRLLPGKAEPPRPATA